nr:MAG TPA: hypothetical protein [Caudoviricetes sp.]
MRAPRSTERKGRADVGIGPYGMKIGARIGHGKYEFLGQGVERRCHFL